MSGNDRSDFSASASIEEAEDSTQGPSRKDRKRARKAAKRAVRDNEDRERLAKRASMLVNKSQESLRTFISCPAMSPHSHQLGSVHLNVPKWDTALLVADCAHLMSTFVAGTQFGDTHDGLWQTLSLRSSDGTTSNDSPSPSAQYLNTDAWHASSYIVPNLLHSFGPTLEGCFERVRLSVVPPSCNVAWHCDYTHAEKHVTRLHIPILCSNGFEMDIGGTIVSMEVGESYIGNFELPHRLSNTAAGTVRVHLIVDIMMPSPTAIIAASATAAAADGSRETSSWCAEITRIELFSMVRFYQFEFLKVIVCSKSLRWSTSFLLRLLTRARARTRGI